MSEHPVPLDAFLAGDLDPEAARRVDEHLLTCDPCWRAVDEDRTGRAAALTLREPADPQLADRVKLAIELAVPSQPSPAPRLRGDGHWVVRAVGAATAVLAMVLGVLTIATLLPRHAPPGPNDSAAMRRIITAAADLPTTPYRSAGPVALDAPHALHIGKESIRLRTYVFHGRFALVARVSRPFEMPPDAVTPTGKPMSWAIQRGAVTIYCAREHVLLAGPDSASELAILAAALHLAR